MYEDTEGKYNMECIRQGKIYLIKNQCQYNSCDHTEMYKYDECLFWLGDKLDRRKAEKFTAQDRC